MSEFDMKSELAHIRRYLGILGSGPREENRENAEPNSDPKKG